MADDGNYMPRCPLCGCDTKFIGSVGVMLPAPDEMLDDYQADRIDCPEGHTFLIIPTPAPE